MEVRNLLSWAVLETSGCRSKNLTPRRPTPVVIPMPLPQKSKELLQPVDTLSQVSAEMAEGSLEGITTSISPTAAASRLRSITPPVDAVELQENANKALKELLATKASIDACRQRAIWELGMELHQNESQATESIKEAKAICSWVTLDARTTCSWVTTDAMTTCLVVVEEAKMTQNCIIQEAEATYSTAIRDVKVWRASQAESLQREHGNIMWDLEAQVIQEESRSQANFLSACQATLYTSPLELKSALAASYRILLGQTPPFILSPRVSPVEEQPASAIPPTPVPKQSPRPNRWHPSPDPVESTPLGRTTLKATLGGSPSSKWQEILPWDRALKPSHAKAFSQDSDFIKEAMRELFSKHSYNFITEGTCNLSEIFKQMATSTDLLGTSIYEIQASWTGPEELKQASYALRSLLKGLKIIHAVPPSESPKVMGLVRIHDPDALQCFSGVNHCPWCRKEDKNEGTMVNHLQMVHYRLGLVCNQCHDCPSTTADTLCHHGWQDCCQPREKNRNVSFIWVITRRRKTTPARALNMEVRTEWSTLGCPFRNKPTHNYSPGGRPVEKASPTNPHIPSPILPQDLTRQLSATFEDEVQNKKFKVVNENS